MVTSLKIYVAIALIIATVLSPLAFSFAPIVLLVWYLYSWRWPINENVRLLTEYFMFFAIALLLAPGVGPLFAPLISLPILLLINRDLQDAAELLTYRNTKYVRRPTNMCLAILLISMALLGISLLLGSLSLLLASAVIVSYLGILGTIVLRQMPLKPVEETQIEQRMVAGRSEHLHIKLVSKTKIGGQVFVESPYEWLKVSPKKLSLRENNLAIKVSLSPTLSGPSIVKLKGYTTDRWGLFQFGFELEPIRLYVIPRARYAAWLARRYLAGTSPGALPLISNIEVLKPLYGLRGGVEYYGNRLYQPGDSLKNIDWKHSSKYNELITKEFAEFRGRSAVLLINLVVGDAEEADKLAYKIIVTAISLAGENIPAALAVYNHERVKETTATLQPRQLLLQSLRIAKEMVTVINPVRYLNPPDVVRLRANISRIRFAQSKASRALAQLLQLEYRNLDNIARLNPATRALLEVFNKVDKQSNIVIISHLNHDAEAITFSKFRFARKGNAVITA